MTRQAGGRVRCVLPAHERVVVCIRLAMAACVQVCTHACMHACSQQHLPLARTRQHDVADAAAVQLAERRRQLRLALGAVPALRRDGALQVRRRHQQWRAAHVDHRHAQAAACARVRMRARLLQRFHMHAARVGSRKHAGRAC